MCGQNCKHFMNTVAAVYQSNYTITDVKSKRIYDNILSGGSIGMGILTNAVRIVVIL